MKPTSELPEDAALPALDVIRSLGLAGAIPALGLQNCPVELLLRRYHRGCALSSTRAFGTAASQ